MEPEPIDSARRRAVRQQAEQFLLQPLNDAARMPVEDTRTLIQQLRLHYVELEAQNEELRRLQVELTEARERYRDLYDFSPVGYLTIDDAGFIVEGNLTAAALLGTDRARLPYRRLAAFVAPSDRNAYDAFWTVARTQNRHSAEIVFESQDHRRCDMRLDLMHISDADPVTPPWRLVLTDVTAQRRDEAERARSETRRQHAWQLHGRQVLAGSVAHHVNDALTTIVHCASMALETLPPAAVVRRFVADIEAAAATAVRLNDQMLAYAGCSPIAVAPLGMTETVEATEPLLRALLTQHATLDFSLAAGLPDVIADRLQIQQVLINLVVNASDALGGGGHVRLRTTDVVLSAHDLATMAHAEEATPGRFVRVDVVDTGAGLTSETRLRMFDPFFSTKVKGRGLGLAVVLGIVNRHRGALDVASRPGHGTCVSLLLPACTADSMLAAPVAGHPIVSQVRRTALVVGDEREERWFAVTVLSRSGLRVLEAADGRQAVDACRDHGSAIDVILLDLDMPGLAASILIEEIIRFAPGARIVLGSARGTETETLPGCCGVFLQKPYSAGGLLEAMLVALP